VAATLERSDKTVYVPHFVSLLYRTDEEGSVLWTQSYDESSWHYPVFEPGAMGFEQIELAADGGFIILGNSYLVKLDSAGDIDWVSPMDADDPGSYHIAAADVAVAPDGQFVVTGHYSFEAFLAKFDESGERVWWAPDLAPGGGNNVIATPDGGYLITGNALNQDESGIRLLLIKTDAEGALQWSQTFAHADDDFEHSASEHKDYGRAAIVTPDGGYLAIGTSSASVVAPFRRRYQSRLLIVKTDPLGQQEWLRTYSYLSHARGNSAITAFDGGYLIIGSTSERPYCCAPDQHGVYLIKIDANGSIEWERAFGEQDGNPRYSGLELQPTADGGYMALASIQERTLFLSLEQSAALIKIDSDGNIPE
jgi:outer membrane protein assembly factor BamB